MLLNPNQIRHLLPKTMKLPTNLEKYDPTSFPNWHTFWALHVGSCNLNESTIKQNAIMIAALDVDRLLEYKLKDYMELGIEIEYFRNTDFETDDESNAPIPLYLEEDEEQ